MAKKSGKREMMVVGSKVKGFIKGKKCMTSSEFLPALNEKVMCLITHACERAKGNKRTTLKARDL
jgi:hypothetical protein